MDRNSNERHEADLFIRFPFRKKTHALCTELTYSASGGRAEAYLDSVIREMRAAAPDYEATDVRSISVGGGSPLLLAPEFLSGLLKQIRELFHVTENAQITVEADPSELTSAWMISFQNMKINRIRIPLSTGRYSDYRQYRLPGGLGSAQTALMLPQIFSIPHYAAEILYGLPGQTERDFLVSTRFCCKFNTPEIIFRRFAPVNHTLWQSLPLADRTLPDESSALQMIGNAKEHLLEKGFSEYAPERFALAGFEPVQRIEQDLLQDAQAMKRAAPFLQEAETCPERLGFGINVISRSAGIVYRSTGTSWWIVSEDRNYEKEDIISQIAFQEQYFETRIEWLQQP